MKVVIEIPDIFVEWAKDEMSVEIFNDFTFLFEL